MSPPAATFTREQLLHLGQSGRPWDFVPTALRALASVPHDHALRFLLAANYARLHLRTAAAEHLALLPPAAAAEPSVSSLTALLKQLPDDRIPASRRVDTCAANLGVLRRRGLTVPTGDADAELTRRFPIWALRVEHEDCFRTGDGNIVRRPAAPFVDPPAAARPEPAAWLRFADDAAAVRALQLPIDPPGARQPPWVVEGIDPPWLFQRLAAHLPRQPDGYWPRLTLIQADLDEFLDGLSLADLAVELAQERLIVLVGDPAATTAAAALAADLERRCGSRIQGPSVTAPSTRRRVEPPVERIIEAATRRQLQEETHLLGAIAELYDNRDPAWWAGRYGDTELEPLRVLIPTCRFSTFVRHSSADLAKALEAVGCQTRLLMEPDDSSLLSSVGYLRDILDFQPDLVVLINYTRANLGPVMHPRIPFVCWIQDAMPHLFDPQVGRRQTALDFVAGHTHAALFDTFGYPRDRAATLPVVASSAKFHPEPVPADLRRRYECEIAFVSHHSEPPDAFHRRLCGEAAATPGVVAIMEELYPQLQRLAASAAATPVLPAIRTIVLETSRRALGAEPEDRLLSLLVNQYSTRVVDRLIRHETLDWAVQIAQRRGWRLQLYGRGWESQPRFAPFARGELEHGESLRASYQCAAVHLHASVNWNFHQRVMECALAGGLPLCRRKDDDLWLLWAYTVAAVARRDPSAIERPGPDGAWTWPVADHPEAMAAVDLFQRLGFRYSGWPVVYSCPEHLAGCRSAWEECGGRGSGMPMAHGAAWMLGDLEQSTFATAADLETAVERALTMPRWRSELSRGIAGRVRQHFTCESAAGTILALVASSLRAPQTSAAGPAAHWPSSSLPGRLSA